MGVNPLAPVRGSPFCTGLSHEPVWAPVTGLSHEPVQKGGPLAPVHATIARNPFSTSLWLKPVLKVAYEPVLMS
jgi:hypothetical protein